MPLPENNESFDSLKRFYAIVPVNYEYNDETYNQQGHNKPTKIFSSKKKAEIFCKQENFKVIKAEPDFICSLTFDLDDLLKDTKFVESRGVNPKSHNWHDELEKAIQGFTTADISRFVKDLNYFFYEVVEVEFDEN